MQMDAPAFVLAREAVTRYQRFLAAAEAGAQSSLVARLHRDWATFHEALSGERPEGARRISDGGDPRAGHIGCPV